MRALTAIDGHCAERLPPKYRSQSAYPSIQQAVRSAIIVSIAFVGWIQSSVSVCANTPKSNFATGELGPEAGEQTITSTAQEFVDRGKSAYQSGNYAEAIENYSAALKLVPNDARLFYNRALAYYKLNDLDNALADFTRTVEITPNISAAFMNRGNIYSRKERFAEAVADYDRAIAIKPDDFMIWFNRGLAYGKLGDNEKGLSDLNEALRLQPYDGASYVARADIFFIKGDFHSAYADYKRAVTVQPNNQHAEQRLQRLEKVVSGGVPGIVVQRKSENVEAISTAAAVAIAACFDNGENEDGLKELASRLGWELSPSKSSGSDLTVLGSWSFRKISGAHEIVLMRRNLAPAIHVCKITSKFADRVDMSAVRTALEFALKTLPADAVEREGRTTVTFWKAHTPSCDTRTTLNYAASSPDLTIKVLHGRARRYGNNPYQLCASCE